ncbi:MAG: hypothetical protein HPY66_0908 [Firmicutes bacterium]|nr:hypothetical protein [Bacillota bacterium]
MRRCRVGTLSLGVLLPDPKQLGGNAGWHVNEYQPDSSNGQARFKGTVQWGDGRHRITILNGGEVLVDEI